MLARGLVTCYRKYCCFAAVAPGNEETIERWEESNVKYRLILSLLAACFFVLQAPQSAYAQTPSQPAAATGQDESVVNITILHVNDTHGQLEGKESNSNSTGWGIARFATVVKEVRKSSTAARVFLVHCGDETSRGEELSELSRGAANIKLMNHLGYDLFVPGNGEFYLGLDALRARFNEANFPVLAANVTDSNDKPLAESYVIEQAGPVKVAFFGLCTVNKEERASLSLKQANMVDIARDIVPILREKADVVVAVTHVGLSNDIKLAGEADGIDVIIGGHSHTVLQRGVKVPVTGGGEVLIAQAGDNFRFCGRVDLQLRRQDGAWRIVSKEAALIPIGQEIQPDRETAALLERLKADLPKTQPATAPASRECRQLSLQPALLY